MPAHPNPKGSNVTTVPTAETGDYLTTGQVGRRIGVTAQYVRELVDAGHFPGTIDVGTGAYRKLRIPEAAVDAFLAKALVVPGEVA